MSFVRSDPCHDLTSYDLSYDRNDGHYRSQLGILRIGVATMELLRFARLAPRTANYNKTLH